MRDKPPPLPAGRGATLPYVEYEAENGTYSGTLLGPSRALGDMANEASGRQAVQLTQTGHHVTFTATQEANSIVVRYSIPDSANGTGITSTLTLYVNGVFRQKLNLTSRYTWCYGGDRLCANYPKTPSAGLPHHFYDESHAFTGDIPAGAAVTLQKDGDDKAAFIVVDLIDLELVGPAIPQPAGSLSLTDCGAKSDGSEAGPAIQNCINKAEGSGQVLYIPAGNFVSTSGRLQANNVTIQGAGMWYSTLSGVDAGFQCNGGACKFYDMGLFGDQLARQDNNHTGGFAGTSGPGSMIKNVWIEHSNNGYWLNNNTNGLTITNTRIRDTWADGVNFNCGTTNSIVEQSELRNTGDDGLAVWSWSACGTGPSTGNTFQFNTVQLPWNAQCFALYGGANNTIEDNLCYDTIAEAGILIAQAFTSTAFASSNQVLRTSLIRAGGNFGNRGAIAIEGRDTPINNTINIQNLDIQSSTLAGIELQGPNSMTGPSFNNVTISNAGTWGIQVDGNAQGSVSAISVVVTQPKSGGLTNPTGNAFTINRGTGNAGW